MQLSKVEIEAVGTWGDMGEREVWSDHSGIMNPAQLKMFPKIVGEIVDAGPSLLAT